MNYFVKNNFNVTQFIVNVQKWMQNGECISMDLFTIINLMDWIKK